MALECQNVRKEFFHFDRRASSIRQRFIQMVKGEYHRVLPLFSLQGFDLQVQKGDSVALLGRNGSGKSTALRLMAGIYQPTSGKITTSGRIAAVIELGAGFNGELTGAENVQLYGLIMGLTRKQLAEHYDEIVEFSGIEDFINIPVKYYSSGMYARLAFSIAICTMPDLLLIDEVLAVGDEMFRKSCLERLVKFLQGGGTLITASHDLATIRDLCSRAVWLDRGHLRMVGDVAMVSDAYQETEVN